MIDDDVTIAETTAEYFNFFDIKTAYVTGYNEAETFLEENEVSLKNFIKYCIKSRSLPLTWHHGYMMPAVAVLLHDLYIVLNDMPGEVDRNSKLYRQWLLFN
jgi:hypothetical protein